MKAALDTARFSTAHWTDTQRREGARLFGTIRKGKGARAERDALRTLLVERLTALSNARIATD